VRPPLLSLDGLTDSGGQVAGWSLSRLRNGLRGVVLAGGLVDRNRVDRSLDMHRLVPATEGQSPGRNVRSAPELDPFNRKGWPALGDVGGENATLGSGSVTLRRCAAKAPHRSSPGRAVNE
jgi:hypothetical protein